MKGVFEDRTRAARAVVLALTLAPPASAAGFAMQSFPVPVSVEGERVRSSMLLQFEIQRYGVRFDAFAGGKLDAGEAAFRDLVLALRVGDLARIGALMPGVAPAPLRDIVGRYREGFAGLQTLTLAARVRVGRAQLFVWEWAAPKGPVRRGFTVEVAADGSARADFVTSHLPLETLIVDLLQQERLHPQSYKPVVAARRYRYAFPSAGRGVPETHPVALLFDGDPVDLELYPAEGAGGADERAGGPAPAVYRAAYRALKDRDLEGYWGAYTEKSRDKLRGWLQAMKPAEFDSFHAATTRGRRLRFVLDAAPVWLVFYTAGDDPRLRYDYLVREAPGKEQRLTNAYFEGFLDDVLGSDALFATNVESFRKNVLGRTNPK